MDDSPVENAVVARERRTVAEKRKIVEQTLESGISVARIARQHGVNANQVFYWRQLYRRGLLQEKGAPETNLLPVRVSEEGVRAKTPWQAGGAIYLESGKARLRIEGRVDETALAVVLGYLLR
jgi:transposase